MLLCLPIASGNKKCRIVQQKPFKMLWGENAVWRKLHSKWVDGRIMENKPHRRKEEKSISMLTIHHIKIKHVTAYASVYAQIPFHCVMLSLKFKTLRFNNIRF